MTSSRTNYNKVDKNLTTFLYIEPNREEPRENYTFRNWIFRKLFGCCCTKR